MAAWAGTEHQNQQNWCANSRLRYVFTLNCRGLQIANQNAEFPDADCNLQGIFTNLYTAAWRQLSKGHDSGLGQRVVRFGDPARWNNPPPQCGTHISLWRSSWCYVSLVPQEQPDKNRGNKDRQVGLQASNFISHLDDTLLADEIGPESPYAFLPLLNRTVRDPGR